MPENQGVWTTLQLRLDEACLVARKVASGEWQYQPGDMQLLLSVLEEIQHRRVLR